MLKRIVEDLIDILFALLYTGEQACNFVQNLFSRLSIDAKKLISPDLI